MDRPGYGCCAMKFNLFANPFAVLELAGDASIGAITARARDLGTPAAAAASRALLIPRNRLLAELGFLPGVAQDLTDASLKALKEQRESELWPRLPLLARANLLAHLASGKTANSSQLRDLVEMQEAIRSSWAETVEQSREHARMPPVPADIAEAILETIVNSHADAYAEGILALPKGADLFIEQLNSTHPDATARANFLRQSAASWDRAVASDSDKDLEIAMPIEAALHDDPDPVAAEKLAKIVLTFAGRTKPSREACRLIGLPHKASIDAAERWRSVALDLNNRQDAVLEAVIVLQALTEGFGTNDELGTRTARDLQICRERIASGEAIPEALRLAAAIEASTKNEIAFQRVGMVNGETTAHTPAIAVELHDAFVAAARTARTDLPWHLLRGFALRLHNEFSATEAALAFTQLAIARGQQTPLASKIISQLQLDIRTLRKQALCIELTTALRSNQTGVARRLLPEIINLTDDPKERSAFQSTLGKLNQRLAIRTIKYAFWGIVAACFLFAIITSNNTPPASRGTNYASPQATVAIDPDAGQPLHQPSPGTAILTRPELRWCRYQDARLQAASDYIKDLNPAANVSQYNAAVDAFNAFLEPVKASCGEFQYRKVDGSVIDSELIQKAAILRAEGIRIVAIPYQAAPIYNPPPTYAPPAYTPPAAPVPPPAPATPPNVKDFLAYSQGQADMRSWLSWFGGLSGAYRDGADWWTGQRNRRSPPSCEGVPATDHAAAFAGCVEARRRLVDSDRRRKSEPDYRAGWNNP
jgi:hypothetical protein